MKEKPMLGNIIENFLRKLGKPLVTFVSRLGQLSLFIAQSLYNTVTPPFYLRLVGRQFLDIGFYSLPVVALTTIFAGMVIALQTYSGFSSFGAESAVAQVVLISVTRELAPVFCGLMVAGRIGAAMAAEIGTMRVTEQIDALVTLSTNPFKYLVAPRLLAGLIVLPLLVLIGDVRHNRVKPGGRFIEKDDFRFGGNGTGQTDALLHTAGKFRRRQISHVRCQSDLTQNSYRFVFSLFFRHILIFNQAESNILPNAQTVKQSTALKQHSHFGMHGFNLFARSSDNFFLINLD
jgi:ABC transport permease subunit